MRSLAVFVLPLVPSGRPVPLSPSSSAALSACLWRHCERLQVQLQDIVASLVGVWRLRVGRASQALSTFRPSPRSLYGLCQGVRWLHHSIARHPDIAAVANKGCRASAATHLFLYRFLSPCGFPPRMRLWPSACRLSSGGCFLWRNTLVQGSLCCCLRLPFVSVCQSSFSTLRRPSPQFVLFVR